MSSMMCANLLVISAQVIMSSMMCANLLGVSVLRTLCLL